MIQPQHGGEVLARQVWRTFHGNVGIGVGRITHHQHLDITARYGVQRLALGSENFSIHGQQFSALHAWAAGARADQQRVIGILERGHRIAMRFHPGQQGKSAILQLHHHTLQSLLRFFHRHFQQLQDHRLVLA